MPSGSLTNYVIKKLTASSASTRALIVRYPRYPPTRQKSHTNVSLIPALVIKLGTSVTWPPCQTCQTSALLHSSQGSGTFVLQYRTSSSVHYGCSVSAGKCVTIIRTNTVPYRVITVHTASSQVFWRTHPCQRLANPFPFFEGG